MQRWTWVQDLLGPQNLLGPQQLKGKSFYLDSVKSRHSTVLVEAITRLGGNVESFLNKDVNIVITGSQEAWTECQPREALRVAGGTKGVASCSPVSAHNRQSQDGTSSQRCATPRPAVCGSRGKALLEKAIGNNERCRGSSVLTNARMWGVKIVHVDDFLLYIERLTAATARAKNRKVEKKAGGSSAPKVAKAGALKSPCLKIEDSSRKYRPLHLQSMVFPTLGYTGRFSPFEPPAPPPPEAGKDQGNHRTKERRPDPSTSQEKLPPPLPLTPSPRRARKKTVGFCECCQLAFKEQDEHLKSDQHRGFVRDATHYSVLDQLVALMEPVFARGPTESLATTRLPSPRVLPLDSSLELDPQAHSEAEKAIQALLSQGSPPRPRPQPARDTAALPVSPERAEAGPGAVPPAASANPAPASSPSPPARQRRRPETGRAREAEDGGAGSGRVEPPAGSSWPAPASRTPGPPETDRAGSGTLRSAPPSPGPNPRKRGRASSLSPRASKRRRTNRQPASDPAVAQSRRAASLSIDPVHPTRKAPPLPVPPPVPAGCSSQSDAPGVAERKREADLESGGGPRVDAHPEPSRSPCNLSPPLHGLAVTGCGNGSRVTSSVSHEHRRTEPHPRGLPDVESRLMEDVLPVVTDLPQPPPPSLRDSFEVSDPAATFTACPQPSPVPRDFSPLPPLPHPSGDPCFPPATPNSDPAHAQSFSSAFNVSGLLPDPSACSPSSSESDWDRGLLSRLAPAVPPPARGGQCLWDLDLLQRPCAGMRGSGYESRLCSVLHPPTPPPSLCGEDTDPALFSRTTDQCLETCAIQGLGVNM
ncbi:serine/arginine repetitive matrix protein 1 [Anguilla anguilla]|uniref:serine/arginine repetitive matrix protein 1 n=1 Tax=Anguilla anguilla TaxID=7936 RepID=UPI0015AF0E33|nr:serine/arginine repetitive matrix protein 1 [Anguilla anguilla]